MDLIRCFKKRKLGMYISLDENRALFTYQLTPQWCRPPILQINVLKPVVTVLYLEHFISASFLFLK